MKTGTIYIALVVVTLAVTVPAAQGLECYRCISGEDYSNATTYHKKCKEGKLPDSLVETCTDRNVLDSRTRQPYNASSVEAMTKQRNLTFSCGKWTLKYDGGETTEKSCSFAWDPKEDYCYNNDVNGVTESECICHGNKCNSAVGVSFRTFTLMTAVFSVFIF